MSLLGHDDVIFIQLRWYHGLFLPASFFYCYETHKMALSIQARHSRIVRRSHEFQSVNHFRFWRSPGKFLNHGTIGRMSTKNYQRYVLSASLYLNEHSLSLSLSLSLWSSVISNLTNCYFLGYWTASLKQNTEWSGQETTSRGRFYSTLGTFQILVLRRCST